MLPGMQAITLTLELDAGGSLRGSASDAAGASKEFSGWLGLMSAVEALLATDSPTPVSGGIR
jgi:hypothetical protein